jgi:hypothetical protein
MSAIAQMLEEANQDRLRRMSPDQRFEEALTLGRTSLVVCAAAHGMDAAQARRCLELASQAGRRPSKVMMEIIG